MAARSTWSGRTTVYRYACPARWDGATVDLDEFAMGQLRLAHELRNRLVELWNTHQDAVAATWLTRVEFAELDAYCDAAERRLEELVQQGKRGRVPADLASEARELRAALRVLRAERKALKAEILESLKPDFDKAKAEYWTAEKATYAEFVQSQGLYYDTYNAVRADMRTAAARVGVTRAGGRPARLRVERWTGEGRLAMSLQYAEGRPRTVSGIQSPSYRNQLRIEPVSGDVRARPGQRLDRMRTVSLKVGSTPDRKPIWCNVPVLWHRELPVDADPKAGITNVELVRRRTAGTFRLSVCVTVNTTVQPKGDGGSCRLEVGMRVNPDQSVLVASWSGRPARPLVVPGHLAGIVTLTPGGGEVRIPAAWFYGADAVPDGMAAPFGQTKVDDLAAIRLQEMARMVHDLTDLDWWESLAAKPADVSAAELKQWRSPARFAALASRCRQIDGFPVDILLRLERWRVQDRHLWEWHGHQGKRVGQRRRDLYRQTAAMLVGGFAEVLVDDQRPTVKVHGPQDRENAHLAWLLKVSAPAELLGAVKAAAARVGAVVGAMEEVPVPAAA